MPIVQKGIAAFSDQLPKVISPKTHAIVDYVVLGGFVAMTALLWKRNRRAAFASLICAASEAANTLLTDYPGGVTDAISFPTHGKIDMGLAATASALPNFLGFADDPEAKAFRTIGLAKTAVGSLTDFRRSRLRPLRRIA